MKKFCLIVFGWLLFVGQLKADNVYVNFIKHTPSIEPTKITNEFYQVTYLKLQDDVIINTNDDFTVEINGETELNAIVKSVKPFADNHIVSLRTSNGIEHKTLMELGYDGRFFKGVDNNGNTNSSINWFNTQISITYNKNGTEYFIQPLTDFVINGSRNIYVLYKATDLKPIQSICAQTENDHDVLPLANGTGGCRIMDQAVFLDYTMYQKYNGNINAMINKTTNVSYLSSTDYTIVDLITSDIEFKIVEHLIPTCASCNPWPTNDTIKVHLNKIKNTNLKLFQNTFDVITEWYAPPQTSGTIGLAWRGSMCDTNAGFLYSSHVLNDYTNNFNGLRSLMSHELGHNFNGTHDTLVNNCIMNPTNNGSTNWSLKSQTEINNYLNLYTPCFSNCASSANICDTIGIHGIQLKPYVNSSKYVIKWASSPNITSMTYRVYDYSTGLWSTPVSTTADSAIHNYNFPGCTGKFIMELRPSCSNNINEPSKQIVYLVDKSSLKPVVTITPTNPSICSGLPVLFTATTTGAGSSPTFQWQKNNINQGAGMSAYSTNVNNGDQIRVIVTSTDACNIGNKDTSNVAVAIVGTVVTPQVTITTTSTLLCTGVPATFTANPVNGGTTPGYQWKVNGTNAGTNASTFTTSTLNNGDIISCELTSNAPCASPLTASSNSITVTTNPSVTASINISTSTQTVCAGSSIIFVASTANGGSTPTFIWKKNGLAVGTSSNVYSGTVANGDVITCELLSSANCVSNPIAVSNSIAITVSNVVNAGVTITSSATNVCPGANVTFTATPANGGITPVYQWKINGVNSGTNSPTFTSTILTNNSVVTCVMTSNSQCVTATNVTSNAITITTSSPQSPTVTIAQLANQICPGSTLTLTANSTLGGTSPTYQWNLNGNNVGSNSSTYISNTIPNGANIICTMTSNFNGCLSSTTAVSNVVFVNYAPVITPTISISNNNTTICEGTNSTFVASITNGGNLPVYQWKVNGVNVGTNSNTFSTSNLSVGSVTISCVLTSNSTACLSSTTANSNNIIMTVNPVVTPDVNISASSNPICAGTPVTFTATATNVGSNISYQWRRNNSNAGPNNLVYTTTPINSGNNYYLIITTTGGCLSKTVDTSNIINLIVNPSVQPSISITTPNAVQCEDGSFIFTSTVNNQGANPTYQWLVNGVIIPNTNDTIFNAGLLANNDIVSCILNSDAFCAIPATVTSAPITVSVIQKLSPNVNLNANSNSICIGDNVIFTTVTAAGNGTPSYQWFWNGLLLNNTSNSYSSTLLEDGDSIYCIMTTTDACVTKSSDTSTAVFMSVADNISPVITITSSINAGAIGTPIIYTANTNVTPNYTIQWFVNGILATSLNNSNTWGTTLLTSSDSVYAKLVGLSGCYLSSFAISNAIELEFAPTSLSGFAPNNFGVYPNPVQTVANIEGLKAGDNIMLYDVAGKLILNTEVFVTGLYQLNMQNLAAGIYQAKFTRGQDAWLVRIIKD
jgi:hypothetical protein